MLQLFYITYMCLYAICYIYIYIYYLEVVFCARPDVAPSAAQQSPCPADFRDPRAPPVVLFLYFLFF